DAKMNIYNLRSNIVFNPIDWLEVANTIKFGNKNDTDYGGAKNGYGGLWAENTLWRHNYPFYPFLIDGIPADIGMEGTGGTGAVAGIYDGNNWRYQNTDDFTNTFRLKINPIEGLELNMD